jgi:sensor histidine kinase YesM
LWFAILNILNPAGNSWDFAHLVFAFGTCAISIGSIYISHVLANYLFQRSPFGYRYVYMLLLSLPVFSIIYLVYWVGLIRKLVYGLSTDLSAYPGQLFAVTTGLHLVIAIITITSLYNSHVHKVQIQLSKVENLSTETQLKNLQQQVNPHFLFNSLNILTALIKIDADRSVLFTQKLSEVYRFFLKTQKEIVISLEEELAFVTDYFYLINCRFGNAFQLEIVNKHDEPASELYIIPGTLQLLVENVIKHNIASEEKPVTISINIKSDEILITNTVERKESNSSGYGLVNLSKRYQLLNNQEILYSEKNGIFSVHIPLIKNLVQK